MSLSTRRAAGAEEFNASLKPRYELSALFRVIFVGLALSMDGRVVPDEDARRRGSKVQEPKLRFLVSEKHVDAWLAEHKVRVVDGWREKSSSTVTES